MSDTTDKKYEYKVISTRELDSHIDKYKILGEEGWDCVGSDGAGKVIFKKEKQNKNENQNIER